MLTKRILALVAALMLTLSAIIVVTLAPSLDYDVTTAERTNHLQERHVPATDYPRAERRAVRVQVVETTDPENFVDVLVAELAVDPEDYLLDATFDLTAFFEPGFFAGNLDGAGVLILPFNAHQISPGSVGFNGVLRLGQSLPGNFVGLGRISTSPGGSGSGGPGAVGGGTASGGGQPVTFDLIGADDEVIASGTLDLQEVGDGGPTTVAYVDGTYDGNDGNDDGYGSDDQELIALIFNDDFTDDLLGLGRCAPNSQTPLDGCGDLVDTFYGDDPQEWSNGEVQLRIASNIATPEPHALVLFATGLLLLVVRRAR